MKYVLTNETRKFVVKGFESDDKTEVTLYRITSLVSIPKHRVRKGTLGGWVEGESNLSQEGSAWVAGEAVACQNAVVTGDALVKDNAEVSGFARVADAAVVADKAAVGEHSTVEEHALVAGSSEVYGYSVARGKAKVYDSLLSDRAVVDRYAKVKMSSRIVDDAKVSGYAEVRNVLVYGNAVVEGKARLCSVILGDHFRICGNVLLDAAVRLDQCPPEQPTVTVSSNKELLVLGPIKSGQFLVYHVPSKRVYGVFGDMFAWYTSDVTVDRLVEKLNEDSLVAESVPDHVKAVLKHLAQS